MTVKDAPYARLSALDCEERGRAYDAQVRVVVVNGPFLSLPSLFHRFFSLFPLVDGVRYTQWTLAVSTVLCCTAVMHVDAKGKGSVYR